MKQQQAACWGHRVRIDFTECYVGTEHAHHPAGDPE